MTQETKRLGAILYHDFEMLDLYGPLEMFGIVDLVEIVTVAAESGPVKAAHGPKTVADFRFEEAPPLDLILIPGGRGTFPALQDERLLTFLKERAPQTDVTMSVCTGSALLAQAGLLDGRRATTNKLYFDLVAQSGAQTEWVQAARWVEDGRFVTSSGVSAGTDMALAVIAKQFGIEQAEKIAIYAEYEWARDPDNDPFAPYLNRGNNI